MKRVRHNVRPGMLSARDNRLSVRDWSALVSGTRRVAQSQQPECSLDLQIVISVDASHHTVRCELLRTTAPTGARVEHFAAKSRDVRDKLDVIQDI